jgi:hypothetical protein
MRQPVLPHSFFGGQLMNENDFSDGRSYLRCAQTATAEAQEDGTVIVTVRFLEDGSEMKSLSFQLAFSAADALYISMSNAIGEAAKNKKA